MHGEVAETCAGSAVTSVLARLMAIISDRIAVDLMMLFFIVPSRKDHYNLSTIIIGILFKCKFANIVGPKRMNPQKKS